MGFLDFVFFLIGGFLGFCYDYTVSLGLLKLKLGGLFISLWIESLEFGFHVNYIIKGLF